MIVVTDAFDTIQHPFWIRTTKKEERDEYFNMLKNI